MKQQLKGYPMTEAYTPAIKMIASPTAKSVPDRVQAVVEKKLPVYERRITLNTRGRPMSCIIMGVVNNFNRVSGLMEV